MKAWHEVHDSREEMPEEIDETSSSLVVYERRNIRQETKPGQDGQDVTEWVYEQREYTRDEWATVKAVRLEEAVQQNRADIDFMALIGGIEL